MHRYVAGGIVIIHSCDVGASASMSVNAGDAGSSCVLCEVGPVIIASNVFSSKSLRLVTQSSSSP